jgi:predicted O-linked N-acetylglucosamine transferase (SPINDLY family)
MTPDLAAALAEHRAGRLDAAIGLYRQVLKIQPRNADAQHLLGLACLQSGQTAEALPHLQTAVGLSGDNPLFLLDLGRGLSAAGRDAEAAGPLQRAVALQPDLYDGHFTLGDLARRRGDHHAAAAHFKAAAEARPELFAPHFNRGLALRAGGDLPAAAEAFSRAVHLAPADVNSHRMLGVCLHEIDKPDSALPHLQTALRLAPTDSQSWYLLANALSDLRRSSDAIAAYRRCLQLNPGGLEASANLGELLQATGRVSEAIGLYRGILSSRPECDQVWSNLLLTLNYTDLPPERLYREHRAWADRHPSTAPDEPDVARDGTAQRRLRLGFVSADLRSHPVAWFLKPLFANLDRGHFTIACYSGTAGRDETTAWFERQADIWRDVAMLDDAAVCRLIGSDRIDVLIDLSGHTAGNRLAVFARRPAPVQLNWLGYPNTTGLAAMDFRLTDELADPAGQEAFHSETLVRLPAPFICYAPPSEGPGVAALPVEQSGVITFASFNNIAKITDEAVAAWAAILAEVPQSRLMLKNKRLDDEGVARALAERFTVRGVAPERVVLIGARGSTAGHLAVYNEVDVALDTFPYNGTTTTCEALWMGVPVVALAGRRHAGRVGVSLLSAVGCPQLVASSVEEYVRLAVALAADRPELSRLRRELRGRVSGSPLCDGPGFARRFESAVLDMCNQRLA